MESNTIELLKECSKGCKMAMESMSQVTGKVSDSKLKSIIMNCNAEHRELEEKTTQLLKQYGKQESSPGLMASAFSWMSTEAKMMMGDNDQEVAKIMMDGCNMGIQSLCKYINKYTDASQESISLAKRLVKVEEEFMEDMKEFL